MRAPWSALLSLAAVVLAGTSHAQTQEPQEPQEPPPETSPGSVPRGGAGAVIVPAPGDTPPKAVKVTMPTLKKPSPPAFPPDALRAGVEGIVTLKLDIDAAGRVTKAEVELSAGHGFDESALAAARGLEFEPARQPDGTAVPARILFRYTFSSKSAADAPGGAATPPADVETIVGTVTTRAGGATLAGVRVVLRAEGAADREAVTDSSGAFRFKNLAPGKYRVEIRAAGFEPFGAVEEIAAGEAIEVSYRLSLPTKPTDGVVEVTVEGDRPPRSVTRRTLEKREIDRIPGTGGDALRSLQSLPGVARAGFGGLLIVRGSAPQDTLTFIDGTSVPLIYHFGGLASVVPTEMLEKIDFYPGNFSAVYGRAMGGIVDVGLRSPKQDGKYHGVVQLDFIDGRLIAEGPVPFVPKLTFLAAGRRSWVDAWLGPVLEEAGAEVTQAPVYYDYQFMLEYRPSSREKLRATFFGSDDAFEILLDEPPEGEPALSGNFGLHTAFQRFQLGYENRFSGNDRLSWTLAYGRDNIDFQAGPFYFLIESHSLEGRVELSHRFARYVTANVGVDVEGGLSNVKVRFPAPPPSGQPPNQPFSTLPPEENSFDGTFSRPAAYAELEIVPTPRARVVPGLRLDYAFDTDEVDVSPRLNARYDLISGPRRTTVKGGVGLYYQPPQFQESIEPFGTDGLRSNRAVHYGLGVEQELTRQIDVSLEGFYKQLDRLPVLGIDGEYTNDGVGSSAGGEVFLKYKPDERFFGWAAYTLSRSVRTDMPGEEEHPAPYDQPHVLTLVGSLQLGRGWEIGARFRLTSGNLHTPYVCNPDDEACDPKRLNAILHAPSGRYVPIPYGADFSERLPLFHQLDLRLDKRWKFKRWQLSFYLDVQNVYNHQNVEGIGYNFNYTERSEVSGLPILPSIGLRGDL